MSGSHPNHPGAPSATAGAAVDPSMEDILASIRRILSEDEAEAPVQPAAPGEDVFKLEESMIVSPAAEIASPPPQESPAVAVASTPGPPLAIAAPPPPERPQSNTLVAPETAAAAAGSVAALLRTLVTEREQIAVYRGGPTIEDLVREEIRPLLKTWLDTNLPPVVERLVRAEIERVVGRAVS